jgi:hypothetical protein
LLSSVRLFSSNFCNTVHAGGLVTIKYPCADIGGETTKYLIPRGKIPVDIIIHSRIYVLFNASLRIQSRTSGGR